MAAGQGGFEGNLDDAPTVPTSDIGRRASLFESINVSYMIFARIFLVRTTFGERIGPHSPILPQHWSCHSSPELYRKALLFTGGCSMPNTASLMKLTSLLCAFALALRSHGKPAALETRNSSDLLCTCNDIAAAISGASQVFFPRMSFSHL
jgi:hypothetical protein